MKDPDDQAEFEPVGEGAISPDSHDITVTDDGGYDRGEDAIRALSAGYPDERDEDLPAHECRSCGAPIPSERTRCDFCLVNQIDPGDATEPPDGERTLTGIIHAIVIAEDKPDAITKSTAAFSTLTADQSTTDVRGVDEYELIANSTGETARQLAREWGQLPDAAPLESLEGQRLLDTVRQNAGWDNVISENTADGENRGEQELDTVVFDTGGEPITGHDELTDLLKHGSPGQMTASQRRHRTSDTDEQLTWIVPAFALQDGDPEVDQPETGPHDRPARRSLSCPQCNEETIHSFGSHQDVPDPEWGGDPIWECARCETPRFGPEPATVDEQADEIDDS